MYDAHRGYCVLWSRSGGTLEFLRARERCGDRICRWGPRGFEAQD
jgi:hypothetical protein